MGYRTIAKPAVHKTVVGYSTFIASVSEIQNETEVRAFLAGAKEAYPQANHYCYAYVLGEGKNQLSYFSDAGEPSGSAGRPILNSLLSARLTNTSIVVARYFGGKKLGIPGLIAAYRVAADNVIAVAEICVRTPHVTVMAKLEYSQLDRMRYLLRVYHCEETLINFEATIQIQLKIPEDVFPVVADEMRNIGIVLSYLDSHH